MNAGVRIVAALLIFVALVLAVLAFVVGRRQPTPVPVASASPASPVFAVVVAARSLPAGVPLKAEQLRRIDMSAKPEGSYASIAALVGRTPRSPVAAGMPLTDAGLEAALPSLLAAGERAIAVPVDATVGVGHAIAPGDTVDIFFTLHGRNAVRADEAERTQARLLLARIRVLSYGSRALGTAGQINPNALQRETQNDLRGDVRSDVRGAARTAVLAVPVADVNRLLLAMQTGKLVFALRDPRDDGVPEPALFVAPAAALPVRADLSAAERATLAAPENRAFAGLDSNGLAGALGAAVPVRRSARPRAVAARTGYVEVIRGTSVSRQAVVQ
ncbi:Flp pilus assembly protein CpaB [Chitinasiproducens palmae]|uniref:Pilus assembly protein CpaB n=1 Tax=Chitinasiproducens palmae TaxID=1770053 RepID=A0A1H2PW15_9BURK|nr:Flp pilus assembly protein CpaB [Chitinasiproducens palmae]SDV51164.1 pilus assembly protein CpaB [Chitinasiproducens palmae]